MKEDYGAAEVYRISAVTLLIKNMERSCSFYSQIPGLRLVYGGSSKDTFTTFEMGTEISKMCLNLELSAFTNEHYRTDFGRIIFHTEDVDKLYSYMKNNHNIYPLKMNHQMLHGVKDIFIYVNLMDISFHLQHQ